MARGSRPVIVTIASGAAVSDAIQLQAGECVLGVLTPSAWTAADIALQIALDGATFVDVLGSDATLLKLATVVGVAASEFHMATHSISAGVGDVPYGPQTVRLRSVNTGSAANVNQGATRSLTVLIGSVGE